MVNIRLTCEILYLHTHTFFYTISFWSRLYTGTRTKPYIHRLYISYCILYILFSCNTLLFQKPLMNRPNHVEMIRHCDVHSQEKSTCICFRSWISKFPTRSKRIDVVSRIIFPLVFALFNISYWSTYLFRDEQEDQQ